MSIEKADIQMKKERDSNLDLLRIVSMLLIVLLHSIDHSGVLEALSSASPQIRLYVNITYALTQVCVNCYVLISGYYLVKSKFRLQKLVALWMEVVFYSFVIKAIFMITGAASFSITSLISCFFPVLTGRYWFITIYFGLYILSPFLNMMIKVMNKKQHLLLNGVLFGLFSVWISIHPSIAGMNSGRGWGITWFVVLYFVAAWFRLYYQPNYRCVKGFMGWVIVSTTLGTILSAGGGHLPLLDKIIKNCYTYDSCITYISTLCLFAAFLNMRVEKYWVKRIIQILAPLTFGVYLIHAHADFTSWLWLSMNLPKRMDSLSFIPYQLFGVILIFLTCSLVDFVRINTIGKVEKSKIVTEICNSITRRFFKIVN